MVPGDEASAPSTGRPEARTPRAGIAAIRSRRRPRNAGEHEPHHLGAQAQWRRGHDFGHRGKFTCTCLPPGRGDVCKMEGAASGGAGSGGGLGDLISRHSHDPDALAVGGELVAAWSQPHRRYHSVAHLMDILVRVEQLADHADDPDAVRLAAWYHDCVYEGLPATSAAPGAPRTCPDWGGARDGRRGGPPGADDGDPRSGSGRPQRRGALRRRSGRAHCPGTCTG